MKSSSPGPGGRLVRGVVTSAAALAVLVGPARSQDVGTSRDTLRMTLPPIGAVVPPRVRLSLATHEAEFRALEQRVSEDSTDARLQAATARAGTEFAAALTDVEAAREALARARGYALRAVALQPEGIEGHYWLAASSGLTADIEGGRTKIRMADAAWKESSWVLERDSLHAGAHHLQGRLHAAVMRLGRIT
ncbi:MAG: hypothetical protein OEZ37_07545, partial [Gemmatimonadota bacterium]|nr:hypothetical protein [Gemmatimonadota bacterium]